MTLFRRTFPLLVLTLILNLAASAPPAKADSTYLLSVSYTAFTGGFWGAVISENGAQHIINRVNGHYKQCGIQFVLESYQKVDSQQMGLPQEPASSGDTYRIAHSFQMSKSISVVNAGDFQGSVSNLAGTTFPRVALVLSKFYNNEYLLAAHELGHFMGLSHEADPDNFMYPSLNLANGITEDQCQSARGYIASNLKAMLR